MHLWKKKKKKKKQERRELLSEGWLQKYAHSPLSERREQAIQAILLSFNHCHFLLQLRNFDTSIKKEQEAVKSLKQLQER